MADFSLRMHGNIAVCVTPSTRKLTTYVLLEQEDWFEKELRFLRRWLTPGMRIIDIGANHGVYALTMAKAVAPSGRIDAFEPTAATADLLAQSIAKNGFGNLQLWRRALSNREGQAKFYTYPNSELNSFTRIETAGEIVEEVSVSTLDHQSQELGWSAIDFVKIDTEGEEIAVIDGGQRFFSDQSPLVMFEIPASRNEADIARLIAKFHGLRYDTYRLIGPDWLLVPLGEKPLVDGFDLNFFACKLDRAAQLAATGLLVPAHEPLPPTPRGTAQALFEHQRYAAAFGHLDFADEESRAALDAYAAWRDPVLPPAARYAALNAALTGARAAANSRRTVSRLCNLARIAIEASERVTANATLDELLTQLVGPAKPPDEPFFPPAARFDAIDPGQAGRAWLLAASFEAEEQNRYFSGYFQQDLTPTATDLYDWLRQTPFHSPEMERRRQLLLLNHGKQPRLMPSAILTKPGPDNLNAAFWAAR